MEHSSSANYMRGFLAAAAFLVGLVGCFVTCPPLVKPLQTLYTVSIEITCEGAS